ncbi:MAG: ATP-binding protein [Sciscionella sp.]
MSEQAHFGSELRRLRVAADLSLTALASRIHYSKGYLSKVETGTALPNHTLAALCDTELGTGGRLVMLVPYIGKRPRGRRPRALAATFSVLPAGTEHFTGRAAELAAVRQALSGEVTDSALVCVVDGMAGVGKTALALRSARELESSFADGCLFLDLRGYSRDTRAVSPTDALDRFLRLLGVPGEDIPSDVDDRAALYRDRLRGKRMLVVLDNVSSAYQVTPLLPAERRCGVLITSRNRLHSLDAAHHISLGTLSVAEGATLIRAVVHANRAQEDTLVDRIVERCGRLPLAIRIAAARYQGNVTWTLADLDEKLADEASRLGELDDGERSVVAAFQLSYQQLSSAQRRIFGLLALHPGTVIDRHSAAALAGAGLAEAERLLNRLEDAHLIIQHARGRYQFHDLIGAFAAESALPVVAEEQQRAAVHRLLDLELHGLESADKLLTPHRYRLQIVFNSLPPSVRELRDRGAALEWISAEWSNLVALCRTANELGMHSRCWEIAYALRGFFFLAKLWDPWIETHTVAVAAARVAHDRLAEAMTLNNLGLAHIDRGDLDEAGEYYGDALTLFREIEDDHGTYTSIANYAWVKHYLGKHQEAVRDLRSAMDFYERSGARRNAAITLRGIALIETELGMFSDSVKHAEQAFDVFRELGLDLDLDATMALNCMAWTYFRSGRHTEAAGTYQQAVVLGERCGSHYERARAETGLGNIEAAADRMAAAQGHWERAQELHPGADATLVGESRARLAAMRRKRATGSASSEYGGGRRP